MARVVHQEAKSHVLVVEDNDSQRRTLTALLEAEGFKVCGCATANEALELLRHGGVDAAVVDLRLPDISGRDLLAEFQRCAEPVDIVIYTGYSSYETAKDAVNLGACGYVEKGGDPGELVRYLHRVIRSRLERRAEELEAAVAERTRELQCVFDAIQHGVQYLDVNLTVRDHNACLEKWIGRPIVGEKCYAAIWGRDAPCEGCAALKAIETKALQSRVVRPVFADGRERYVHLFSNPMLDKQGDVIGVVEYALDITDKKEAEQRIVESEQRFRALFEHMPSGAAIYEAVDDGRDFVFTDFNSEAEIIEEKSREEVLGKRVTEAFPGVEESGILDMFRRVWKTGQAEHLAEAFYRDEHVSGTWRESRTYRLPSGQIVAVYNDVTDRKRAALDLQASERKFRILAETIEDVFWMSSPGLGKSLYVSPAYERIWGRSREEFAENPMAFLDSVHPDDRQRYLSVINESHAKSRVYKLEYRIIRPDGEERWICERGFPVPDGPAGEPVMAGVCTDVTARKQADEMLRESEARFRGLFKNMKSGVAVYRAVDNGEDFVFEEINPSGARIGRRLRDEHLGHSVQEVYPGTQELGLLDVFREVWRTGEPRRHPVSLYQDDRVSHWVENYVYKLPSGEIVAVYDDVTEQKEARAALVEARQRLELALRSSNVGLWDWDFTSGDVIFSPEWKSQIGYRDDEIEGRYEEWKTRLHPDDAERTLQALRAYVKGTAPTYSVEFRFRHKDGSYRWIWAQGEALPDREGKPARMLGCHVDITHWKKAEEDLRHSRQRFKMLADMLPQTVFECDVNGTLTYVNRAAFEAFGYTQKDFEKGLGAMEMLAPTEQIRGAEMAAAVMAGEAESGGREYMAKRKDGSVFPVVVYSSPLVRGDEPVGMRGLIVDVTEQRKAEQELRQRDAQLAHLNRLYTVGELAGTLAHELNQPLYAINNYVRGIQRRLQRQNSSRDLEPVSAAMDYVSREVERAASIVSHLREFVRDRGPRRSSVDVGQLLQHAAKLLQPVAHAQGVALDIEVGEDLPPIQADPTQVEQVVVNLVTNAVQAAAGLPEMRRRVTISACRSETGSVEVVVQDLGGGIPDELKDKVFEAFVTTKEEGLGMGLAISRSIVDSHGGKIWAIHNQPHGSSFHFTLPVRIANRE